MKVAIIDCNNLCYRSMFTIGGLSAGEIRTGIIYGFLSQVLATGKKIKPDQFVFCWDSKKSKRKEVYPDYKKKDSKRKKEMENYKVHFKQFSRLRFEILPGINLNNNFVQKGYEADDLIASIVLNYNYDFVVISSDDDLLQLLDNCRIINPHKNKNNLYTRKDFVKQHGISPKEWVRIKQIAGCNSDNVPGITGVGEKKALEYIKGQMNEKSKTFRKIQENEKFIEDNNLLVKLPFPGTKLPEIDQFHLDTDGLRKVCKKYEIKRLISPERLDEWKAIFSKP